MVSLVLGFEDVPGSSHDVHHTELDVAGVGGGLQFCEVAIVVVPGGSEQFTNPNAGGQHEPDAGDVAFGQAGGRQRAGEAGELDGRQNPITLNRSEPPRVSWRLFGLSQAATVVA